MKLLALLFAIDLFSLPTIPETIQVPADRLAYLADHYWDSTPLSIDLIDQNQEKYEQYLVDFLSLLPLMKAEDQSRLLRPILAFSAPLVRQYLCTPDSPIYAPDVYLNTLKSFSRTCNLFVLQFDYREDCETCKETQEMLEKSQLITDAVADGRLQIKASVTTSTPLLTLKDGYGKTLISEIKTEDLETILHEDCSKN